MMDDVPLPERGVLRKDFIYRVPAPRTPAKRELDAETLEIIERGRRKQIREYQDPRRSK